MKRTIGSDFNPYWLYREEFLESLNYKLNDPLKVLIQMESKGVL